MTLARLAGETLGHGGGAVLSDVTLSLSPGERLVLLGRSGSGKPTLLNALHERLVAGGHRVALAPQDYALVPQLSVLRNTLMGRLDDHGAIANLVTLIRPGRARRAEVAPLLDRLGLGPLIDRPVQSLSGGQRQRTALARALYRGGAVLIADEPVSAVDETQAEALLADPEQQTRELLDFCGLPFDEACLRFHEAERSVRTASAAQVRQPLNRDTARAARYGALLDPLRRALAR